MTATSLRSRQLGQSMTEYVVVCSAIAFALGIGMLSDESALRTLVENFRTGYERFSFALSLPI